MAVTPERWRRIEELFARAVELPAAERASFVGDACGDDTGLRAELDSLLAATDGAATSLERAIADSAASLAGGRFGPYRVERLIGEGGMGTVYLAERDDAEYRRRVAIKVLRGGLASPQAVARFRDERQVLAALDHPGIVRLLDGGRTDDGTPYLVMEHVEGAPFAAHARTLAVRERVALVIRIAQALQYAHQQLIVHRDVKPSNLLVDRDGAPKLLDFGIAKLLDPGAGREAETRTGSAAFTVEYASPEQVRGEPVTVATDVYSLGAVLYDVLVGRPPQRAGATMLETLENICEREPARPSTAAPVELRREIAGDLDNILLRALAKRPERRYPSMAAFADDLSRYLSGLPVAAREATLVYRAGKMLRRHRGAVALAVLVTGALSAATIVSIRQARNADRQAARAEAGRRTLLIERGRQELATDHPGRALPYLAEALRAGADTPAVRVLLGAAMRRYQARIAMLTDVGDVIGAAWSPDGSRVVLTSARSHSGLFDRDGRLIARLDGGGAQDLRPTFNRTGTLLAAADTIAGRLFVWDAATGERLQTMAAGTCAWQVEILFLDDDRVATTESSHHLVVWDAVSGTRLASTDVGCPLLSVAVSADGATVATSCLDGVIRTFDAHTLAPGTQLHSDGDGVWRVALSRDGGRLYAANVRTTTIWDLAHRTPIATVRGGSLELSADGSRLVTAGDDSIGRIYDATNGRLQTELIGHDFGGLRTIHWSRDGTTIATAGIDGVFRTWDATTGEPNTVLEASVGARASTPIGALAAMISPDGSRLLTIASGGSALWRIDRAPLLDQIRTGGELWSAAWSPDEQRIATAGMQRLGIHRAAAITIPIPGGVMYDVNWSPDGARVVIAGKPDVARVLDGDGTLDFALTGHTATVNRAAFSPDGRSLATASGDGTARIWDAATGEPRRVLAHPGAVLAAAWSRDGTRLATAGIDHHLRVWDAANGTLMIDLDGSPVEYLDVTISPDGRALAAAGRAGEAEIWDLTTRKRRMVLVGHTLNATNAAWSRDGALIATASSDHTARVWDPVTGAQLAMFRHPHEVMSLQWSRDDARLLTGCYDGNARVWDVHRAAGTPAEISAFVAAHAP